MQTVNLLTSVSVGSTPSLPTFRLLSLKDYDTVLSRLKCSVRIRQESYFRTGCVQLWNCSVLQDMNKATVLGNLVSAHYEHDEKKFAAYVQFIIDAYEERGEKRQAEIIRKRMDGSYKLEPKVSLDNIKIPDEFPELCRVSVERY